MSLQLERLVPKGPECTRLTRFPPPNLAHPRTKEISDQGTSARATYHKSSDRCDYCTLNVQETRPAPLSDSSLIIRAAPTRVMQVVARSARSAVAASGRYTAQVLDLHLQCVLVSTALGAILNKE